MTKKEFQLKHNLTEDEIDKLTFMLKEYEGKITEIKEDHLDYEIIRYNA
jgi:hypothetical protein